MTGQRLAVATPQHVGRQSPGPVGSPAEDQHSDELSRIRILRAPRPDPHPAAAALRNRESQPTLDLEFALPGGASALPRPQLQLVRSAPVTPSRATLNGVDDFSDRQRTPTADLPDPSSWAARIAQAIAEIRSGARPPHQMARWATHELLCELRRAHSSARRDRSPSATRVSSIHIGQPTDGVIEGTAIVRRGQRCRAMALRLEGWDGRWICVSAGLV